MTLSRKAKEAIKTGLALALAYIIALWTGWLNPQWAGLAVAMISLQTAGESIHKGVNRMIGTVPAAIAAFVILGLGIQNSAIFMSLTCTWIAFTVYMQLQSKKNSYLWMVAGFACLVLITGSGTSSESIFEHAVFRLLDTALGIIIYTLVAVFLWPCTNAGAIKKASAALTATQAKLCRTLQQAMLHADSTADTLPLQQTQLQQLGALNKALTAEGAESYEVRELSSIWATFQQLSTAAMDSLSRWQSGLTELAHIQCKAALPDADSFFEELERRFKAIEDILSNKSAEHLPQSVSLTIKRDALSDTTHMDRAALIVAVNELNELEAITANLLNCVRNLSESSSSAKLPKKSPSSHFKWPIPDIDHMISAAYASSACWVGYLIWIYIDPPGHMGWVNMLGTIVIVTIGMPQMPVIKLVKPLAFATLICTFLYIIVMPRLSNAWELGFMLFGVMFIARYYFTGGTQLMMNMGIVNLIPIQNEQTYNFAAQANMSLFMIMVFVFLFGYSYLINAPRPEKKVMALVRRFFQSASFLMEQVAHTEQAKTSFFKRRQLEFHQREIKTLPLKIESWSKAINPKKFPNNTAEQKEALVYSLQELVYRMDHLREASHTEQAQTLIREMGKDLHEWHQSIQALFAKWKQTPEAEPSDQLQTKLSNLLHSLEERINQVRQSIQKDSLTNEDAENFYRLIGAYRSVSEGAVAYAIQAGAIDWNCWREERF